MTGSIGDRLRQLRVERGLSQADLARDIVSASYVSLIEAGKRLPDHAVLVELANRLKTSPEFLADGVDHAVLGEKRLALQYAELALASGNLDDALTQFRKHTSDSVSAIRVAAWWGLARVQESLDNLEDAIATVESLLSDPRVDEVPEPGRLALENNLCWLYREAGDVDHAITLGQAALSRAHELGLGGTEDEMRLATTVVGCFWERGDLTRAHLLIQDVIRRAEHHGSHQARGSAYWNASMVADSMGQLALAIQFAERALALLGEDGHDYSIAQIRIVLASMLVRGDTADLQRAEEILTRSLDLMTHLGIQREIVKCESELALVHLLQGRLVTAAQFASRVIERLDLDNPVELVRARLVYAQTLAAAGDVTGGREQVRQAYPAIEGLRGRRARAQLWRDTADVLDALGHRDEALVAYRKAADSLSLAATPTAPALARPARSARTGDTARVN